jgi:hypothetical protein
MIPLITRRSSTRGMPYDSGKNGDIRAICRSLNKNISDMTKLLRHVQNHIQTRQGKKLMGPDPRPCSPSLRDVCRGKMAIKLGLNSL